jgi:hypothetical protein
MMYVAIAVLAVVVNKVFIIILFDSDVYVSTRIMHFVVASCLYDYKYINLIGFSIYRSAKINAFTARSTLF